MNRRKWFKRLALSLTIIALVVSAGVVYFYYLIDKQLPDIEGELVLKGLHSDVSVIRDSYGIPHIYAKSDVDAYYVLGYVIAQDRLWQMDFLRRVASGRLSEILPKNDKLINLIDKPFRTFCIKHYSQKTYDAWLAKEKGSKELNALHAYVKGINAFIEQNKDHLPIEFNLLMYDPEPFTEVDCLSIAGYMAMGFNPTLKAEPLLGKLIKEFGSEMALEIYPEYKSGGTEIIDPKAAKMVMSFEGSQLKGLYPYAQLDSLGGSNSWVISGKKSNTGQIVIANDPHILFQNPSIWYEAHIKTDEQNFYGFFLPLVPFGLIGHNDHVGWGITMLLNDASDFYIEKLKKVGSDNFYLYKNQWIKAETVHQELKIRGSDSIHFDVPITRHGPVISSLYNKADKDISIRWALYDTDNLSLKTFYFLNHAKNTRELKSALRYHKSPGINVLYGDLQGNIGYYAAGAIPIRSHKGDGIFPMDGTDGNYEWQGFVPFEEQPQLSNPKSGYIVTANNKVVDDSYPYYISRYWETSDRADRIKEMIETMIKEKDSLSIEDHRKIHKDVLSNSARTWTPMVLKVCQKAKGLNETEKKALTYLQKWDYQQDYSAIAPTLYNRWYILMLKNTLKDELGAEDFETYVETRFSDKLFYSLFKTPHSKWFDDVNTKDKIEQRDDIILQSFKETIQSLTNKLGDDISQWRWERRHQITFTHPFGLKKPFNLMFNVGPFAIGGNRQTVNKAHYRFDESRVIVGPSMRMILDFSDLSKSKFCNTTGQSGHFNNKHYKDQTSMWLNVDYRQGFYNKEDVLRNKEGILRFMPN